MITEAILRKIMPNLTPDQAVMYVPHLQKAMLEFEINTKARVAVFLAQLAHESIELTRWVENLNYSAGRLLQVWPKRFSREKANAVARNPEKIANFVYANRGGNGDEVSGDGWRFRGRSPIQLTLKENYVACGRGLGLDLVANPDLLLLPEQGFRAAAWFWKSNGLNELADKDEFKAITRRINGGLTGYNERLTYYQRACRVI